MNTTSPPDPVKVSWSSLKRWENCPQHQLRVIKGETKQSDKGRIFLPGTTLDLVMRKWLDEPDPQPGQMVEMVESIFTNVVNEEESKIKWFGDPKKDQAEVKMKIRTAAKRLEPWLMDNVLPYDYEPEKIFKAHMQIPYVCDNSIPAPVMLRGGIDIVVRDDQGKFRIYDLKMTEDAGYIKSTLAQLTFYDLAWGVIQGDFYHAVEWGFVAPMLEERFIPVTVGREDRAIMLSRIIKYAQGVWRDEWAPKADDTGCSWCEAKGACDKFRMVSYVDENGKQKASFSKAAEQRAQFRSV